MEARQRGWEELRNGAEPSSRGDLGLRVPPAGSSPARPRAVRGAEGTDVLREGWNAFGGPGELEELPHCPKAPLMASYRAQHLHCRIFTPPATERFSNGVCATARRAGGRCCTWGASAPPLPEVHKEKGERSANGSEPLLPELPGPPGPRRQPPSHSTRASSRPAEARSCLCLLGFPRSNLLRAQAPPGIRFHLLRLLLST